METIIPLLNPVGLLAYIEPGGGSMVIQVLLATVLGSAIFLRRKIMDFIGMVKNIFKRKTD
jgi:hypothetical protein